MARISPSLQAARNEGMCSVSLTVCTSCWPQPKVTVGNPPVRANGSSWAVLLGVNLWLYIDASDSGKLKLFNDTGSTLRTPYLRLSGTETNKR